MYSTVYSQTVFKLLRTSDLHNEKIHTVYSYVCLTAKKENFIYVVKYLFTYKNTEHTHINTQGNTGFCHHYTYYSVVLVTSYIQSWSQMAVTSSIKGEDSGKGIYVMCWAMIL